jgi:hypothetical protein
MFILFRGFVLSIAIGMLSVPAYAEDAPKEQIKNLDEQIQEVKTDALGIGADLRQLEEKLLYPSSTQVAIFVSLDNAATFRLDSIEIQLDGKTAAQHLYTLRELTALQKGGLQRIYTGNVRSGEHGLQVLVTGKPMSGSSLRRTESFKFSKDMGPKMLEVHLVDPGAHMITLRDW